MARLAPKPIEAAFSAYARQLEADAANITRNVEDARDATADAFLRLVEKGPDDPDAMQSWLYTTTRNAARNRVRKRVRLEERLPKLVDGAEETDVPLPDSRIAELLSAALHDLSERDRQLLRLRIVEQRRPIEIAKLLDTTPGNVRVLVHRASTRLRSAVIERLADHHGVSADCRRHLLQGNREHRACATCTTVTDEISALTGPMAAGLLGPLAQAAARGRQIIERLGVQLGHRVSSHPGLGDAALAMVAATWMAVGVAPTVNPGGRTQPIELARPSPSVLADAVPAGSRTSESPSALESVAFEPVHLVGSSLVVGKHRQTPARHADDLHPLVAKFRSAVDVPDPIGDVDEPPADIVAMEVGTLARSGEPVGLRFILHTLEPPTVATSSFKWRFEDGECEAQIYVPGIDQEGGARLTSSCREPVRPYRWHVESLFPDTRERTQLFADHPLAFERVGTQTTVDLFVDSLRERSERFAAGHQPGQLLTQITGATWNDADPSPKYAVWVHDSWVSPGADLVPNDRRDVSYRVGAR